MVRRSGDDAAGFVELLLPAQPRYVAVAREHLRVSATNAGFTTAQVFGMSVAMSEAFTNVIVHANTTWVTLRYAVEPHALTIEVEDDGEGFDTAILDQPYTANAERRSEERRVGKECRSRW